MKAGAAKVVITPPVGCDLAGYIGRLGRSRGVHDDLYARALVVQNEDTAVALISVDLIGLDAGTVHLVRQAVQKETGIAADHVMLACSHTHSGPSTPPFFRLGRVDQEWLRFFQKAVAGCVRWAAERLEPATVAVGTGSCRIGINRRGKIPAGSVSPEPDLQGVVDDEVGVIRIDRARGGPLAAVVNYGCHPVVLEDDNLLISGDFPSMMTAFLERSIGGETIVLFTNGGAGNVNPVERGTFAIAEKLAGILGAEALKVFLQLKPVKGEELACHHTTVSLPLQKPSQEELEREIELCQQKIAEGKPDLVETAMARARLAWAQEVSSRLHFGTESWDREAELQALRLGPVVFVAAPAELFAETCLNTKSQLKPDPIFISTYTNGYLGYVPPAEAYSQGGYEVLEAHKYLNLPSAFDPTAEGLVVQNMVELARRALAS
jgi:hypothetical protein